MDTLALLKNKFVNREIDDGLFRDIYELMQIHGVNAKYQQDDNRILFNLVSRNGIIDNKYKRECNGLIIDIESWRIICLSSFNFQRSRDVNTKKLELEDFDIVDIQDGTIITAYNYYGEWILSTHNSVDARESQWVSLTTSFSYAFFEILHKRGYDFRFDRLNPSKCYTFGFKHPEFHPYDEGDNYKIWFIQSVNLEKIYKLNILSSSEYSDKIILYVDKDIGEDIKSQYSNNSFNVITELNSYINKNQFSTYGFLLRNKNIKKDSIMIDSILMKNIKKYYYDVIVPKGTFNKNKYIIINSYTDTRVNTDFTKMFPKFKHIYNELDNIIHKITNMVIDHIPDGFKEDYENNGSLTELEQKELKFADYIFKTTQIDYKFDNNTDKNMIIIENNIYRKSNIESLLELVTDE